jgi:hypothetical protein
MYILPLFFPKGVSVGNGALERYMFLLVKRFLDSLMRELSSSLKREAR